jgi:unsaturated rhamnogalacturonyl hydrolase
MISRLRKLLFVLFVVFVHFVQGQQSTKNPIRIARAIVERIERETSFQLHDVAWKPVLDIQVVDFGKEFGRHQCGVAYTKNIIKVDHDTTIAFGLSRDFPLTIRINGESVYSAEMPGEFVFSEIGYETFRFGETVRFSLKQGENTILIKGRLSEERNVLYLRELATPGAKVFSRFGLANSERQTRGSSLEYIGVFDIGIHDSLNASLPPDDAMENSYFWRQNKFACRSDAPRVIKELSIKQDAAYRRESYAEWQYPNGTVMLSLLKFSSLTNDTSVYNFVKKYCDFTIDNSDLFRDQYERLHAFRGTNHKLYRGTMLDDTGGPALPFVELYAETCDPRVQPLVVSVARHMALDQVRLRDGTFCRYEPIRGTVWADDLFMSVPFLIRMGRTTGDSAYFDDAAHQAVNFRKYLVDKSTGLYSHGWFDNEKRQSKVAWGRANGWIVWATIELLEYLPASNPLRKEIVDNFQQHVKALVACQAPSGLWHQVLNRPDSYEETSCSAMFIIGLARGLRLGILDNTCAGTLTEAWAGLRSRISENGIVQGICRGTELSDDTMFYLDRERFDNDPRGLGAVIMACIEMAGREEALRDTK